METDGQRQYSVPTRNQLLEKMMKEIDQISEVFAVSKSDATVMLTRLNWNTFQVSDRLGDDKEKFLLQLGLVCVPGFNQSGSITLCANHGDQVAISTPFCVHKYCVACWRDYLKKILKQRGILCCPHKDCVASIGPDTIDKLDESVQEMYESFILEAFVESKKDSIKWCPAFGCGYAIEIGEDVDVEDGFSVVCLCGHTSCWNCQLESHQPVTCKNASRWWTHQSKNACWIARDCPNCNIFMERRGFDLRMLICTSCGFRFCSRCFRPEKEHGLAWRCHAKKSEFTQSDSLSLWKAAEEALEDAKRDLKFIEKTSIPKYIQTFGLNLQEQRALREAWMLIVQCTLFLKWGCVFDYFISENQTEKKQYLSYLRDEALKTLFRHRETVIELMKEVVSSGNLSFFSIKLSASTTSTGNFFHESIKTLENGMPKVMFGAYEIAPTSYWLCVRCKSHNVWSDKDCKSCLAPHDSPIPHSVDSNSASVPSVIAKTRVGS